jgi:hypothetical protein
LSALTLVGEVKLTINEFERQKPMAGFGTGKYELRIYEDGDEAKIVKLFDKAYSNYGGYVRKTPEYWRWCCLQRPDVGREGILVAMEKATREIVGYVVAGKSGSLWELTCPPHPDKKEIVTLLLDNAVSYLEQKGVASVNFTAPQADLVIGQACKEQGFATGAPPKMFLSVLDFQKLFFLIANGKADELKEKFDEILLIRIKDAPFWVCDTICVKINRNEIAVGAKSRDSTIQVDVDYLTFCSLLFGNSSPFGAFARFRLKVRPLFKTSTLLRFLSALQIRTVWSFQLSEFG